jgi:hypothetical protein
MKTLISLTLSLFLSLYCSSVQCASPQTLCTNTDNPSIVQLIKQAVEYEWWSDQQDYQVELSKFNENPALENITQLMKQYKEVSTDWYSLTFIENCHIVYNNGNIAIVIASLKETDITTNDIQTGKGVFILHNTSDGWRIREMNYYWHAADSQLLYPEVTTP